jgi:hypothetical protein
MSMITPGKPAQTSTPPTAVRIPKLPSGPITGLQLVDLHKKFKRLQNGSDVRGIAIEGEEWPQPCLVLKAMHGGCLKKSNHILLPGSPVTLSHSFHDHSLPMQPHGLSAPTSPLSSLHTSMPSQHACLPS